MSEPSESPIIGRLKEFMVYCQLTNSQFADYTGIPRPTLSQLLHGRNKSVNDQLIKKLHDSFPNLNIVWLLFGKGEMLLNANSETSGTQNSSKSANSENQFADNKQDTFKANAEATSLFTEPNEPTPSRSFENDARSNSDSMSTPDYRSGDAPARRAEQAVEAAMAASLQANLDKKIKSIIVFYSDNSFETFFPA